MKKETGPRMQRQTVLIRRMVITAMLGAITALLAFTPVGMITLPPPLPAVTLVHIPVILAALVEGPIVGVAVGLLFGLCSLIRAWGSGMVGLTLFFRNPLVSVLPRMIIPLTAWATYTLWKKLTRRDGVADKIGAGVASAVGALTNTVLCLGAIQLLYGSDLTVLVNHMIALGGVSQTYLDNAGVWLVAAVGLPNGLAELTVAAILVPMIKAAVDALNRRGKRGKPPIREDSSEEYKPDSKEQPTTELTGQAEADTTAAESPQLSAESDAAATAAETAEPPQPSDAP